MIKIGVLDVQGSVIEHITMLNKIEGVMPIKVKYAHEIQEVDGMIIPGGESTTMGKMLKEFHLDSILKSRIQNGMPVWGTCAGMILLANKIKNEDCAYLKVMNINVKRNAYGSQMDSFVVEENIPKICKEPIPLVFIRAPYIENIGDTVEVIKKLNGKIVAAKEKNMFVTSFHPELTSDDMVHRYFIRNFFK